MRTHEWSTYVMKSLKASAKKTTSDTLSLDILANLLFFADLFFAFWKNSKPAEKKLKSYFAQKNSAYRRLFQILQKKNKKNSKNFISKLLFFMGDRAFRSKVRFLIFLLHSFLEDSVDFWKLRTQGCGQNT